MADQKLNPNHSPPPRILLESSMETTSDSRLVANFSNKEKDKSSKGLWKSLKSKANVFSIFERGKSPQPPRQQEQQSLTTLPFIRLGASLNLEYVDDDDTKLKNEYDRAYRRSGDDERRKASARITITTTDGEHDFVHSPGVNIEPPSGIYQARAEVDYAAANQSTTASSAISHKTNADDALFDFPDLGGDLAKYIRDGTPTPTFTEETAPMFGFIPFDEKIESYDEDFELNYESPEVAPRRVRTKSVRFASNDTDIEVKNAVNKAVEVHQKRLERIAAQAESVRIEEDDKSGRPGCESDADLLPTMSQSANHSYTALLPRPNIPMKTSSQGTIFMMQKPRTPSPTKTLRHGASNTSIAKRSPSPGKSPLGHKESMTFRAGRNVSATRAPSGFVSSSKASLIQHALTSPSKNDHSYVSPTKSAISSASSAKTLPNHMRSYTSPSPRRLTAENTRANTPTSPTKLRPIRSHTSPSPSKSRPARSHTPPSPTRKLTLYGPAAEVKLSPIHSRTTTSPAKATPMRSHTSTTPITAIKLTSIRSHTPPSAIKAISSAHDSVMRGKEAHEEAARRKAIEVAELKQQNQKLLMEKRIEEDRILREKRSEAALRRKASQGVLKCNAMDNNGPASPALSRIPIPVPKAGSRLPVLKKMESTALLRRPAINEPPPPTTPMTRPTTQMVRPATTVTAAKPSKLKPKDSKQSLRPKTSQSQLGNKSRGAPSKPAGKSKLGQELQRN